MITSSSSTLELLVDPGYPQLKDYLIAATGMAYYCDKDEDLAGRIAHRMADCGLTDCTSYYHRLSEPDAGDKELDRLIEELTVGETFFFRHTELFDGFRDVVLPDVLERNSAQRRLRIWSAGCSIGAEVYSVAIMLARQFAVQTAGWEISILGTDINRKFLNRASEGVFHAWDFRGSRQKDIEECFIRRGDAWTIKPEFRRHVSFQYHNLVRHPFPSLLNNLVAFDIILCRNVLIYFQPELGQKIIDQFHPCLVDGGWLLVGHAEPNTKMFRSYRTVNVPGAVLYQKAEPQPAIELRPPLPPRPPVFIAPPPGKIRSAKVSEAGQLPGAAPARPLPGSGRPEIRLTGVDPKQWQRLRELADTGDIEQAAHQCAALTKANPMNPALHLYMAMLAEQMGRRRQAEQSLRSALYLKPDNALAHYYCGLFHRKHGHQAEALRSFANVLKYLADRQDTDEIAEADGMSVADLRELTRMQQEVLAQ